LPFPHSTDYCSNQLNPQLFYLFKPLLPFTHSTHSYLSHNVGG
jgi:hypothetical protein